jgi:nitroreductase
MDLLEGIYTRRSIRKYTSQPVERSHLMEIIKAGTWAPSGLNNQPWRFVIITNEKLRFKIARLTRYHQTIENAPACIAVFVDKDSIYDELKDHQAMGACIQNMLLAAHALGLGTVWLGEILKNSNKVGSLLEVPDNLELMAVVAIGYPAVHDAVSHRREVSEVLIREY